jgi:hypothetical protein
MENRRITCNLELFQIPSSRAEESPYPLRELTQFVRTVPSHLKCPFKKEGPRAKEQPTLG